MSLNNSLLALPDCVPARMVNEFAYCSRLAYIEWVQGDFQESADTVEGRYVHRIVDREGGALPAPTKNGIHASPVHRRESEDEEPGAGESETIHARSVWLSAPDEYLTARIDLVEGEGDFVSPVDYKLCAVPNLPELAWEPDRVQLCAQGLVLRGNGFRCEAGVIYYSVSKTRVTVIFEETLIARTRELVRGLRELGASEKIPPPLDDSPKCPRCSLAPICLPDETRLLAVLGHESIKESDDTEEERVRRLMPARDDALPFYIQEQGGRISKSGEVFEAWSGKEKLGESRIFETSQIALFGNIQITTQALAEAIDRGIPVSFFTLGGWFRGIAHGMSHRNVELRLSQYRAATDPACSLELARAFVSAKIRNCRTLVMRNHPEPPPSIVESLARLAKDACTSERMASLLGVEALAAKQYFSCLTGMFKPRPGGGAGWQFDFDGRNRRPPRDPVNAMLSYAYSLLAKDFTVTALAVGMDPFLGFYHQPRYGRPSLALDLMEEFRPLVGDSVVLNIINNGILLPTDFILRGKAAAMTPAARKKFLGAYENRMDTLITHPVFGYRISYRRVLEVQVRLLGRFLAGEISEYPSFTTR